MTKVILKAENISKQYRLGLVGSSTIKDDVRRFWANICGKDDPFLKVGEVNDRASKGSGDYVWALRDINFEVQQGEVLGIIGKNGAGKSTLLKILSRVTAPTTGSIKTRGRIASLLEVGTGFHPELTGRENIYLNGAILGMTKSEIKGKLDEIIDFSGCERYIDTPTKRYSSGMTVRLAFSVAAHLEPEILVVDEVLAVGDAEFQKKAIGKMQDISKGEGRTVLFVSHNMTAVRNLCTRAISLKSGYVFQNGVTHEVIKEYLADNQSSDAFTSQFVERVSLGDNRAGEVKSVALGSAFSINIQFKNNFQQNIDYCFLGIYNADDVRVASISCHHDKTFLSQSLLAKLLNCTVPNLILSSGNYRVMLAVGTSLPRENIEVIDNVLSFKIVDEDYFGNGVSLLQGQGQVVLGSNWSVS